MKNKFKILIGVAVVAVAVATGILVNVNKNSKPTSYSSEEVSRKDVKIEGAKNVIITQGEEVDLLKGVSAVDGDGNELTVLVSEYDVNKVGNQTVTYTVFGVSEGVCSKDITLTVLENPSVTAVEGEEPAETEVTEVTEPAVTEVTEATTKTTLEDPPQPPQSVQTTDPEEVPLSDGSVVTDSDGNIISIGGIPVDTTPPSDYVPPDEHGIGGGF